VPGPCPSRRRRPLIRHWCRPLCYTTFTFSRSLLVWTTQFILVHTIREFLARRKIKFSSTRILSVTRAFPDLFTNFTSLVLANYIFDRHLMQGRFGIVSQADCLAMPAPASSYFCDYTTRKSIQKESYLTPVFSFLQLMDKITLKWFHTKHDYASGETLHMLGSTRTTT